VRETRAHPITLSQLARAQATYFIASGVWPLIHLPSFERVLGDKKDHWLVRTVALLVIAIGATLARAASRHEVDGNIRLLGALGAAAPGAISLVEGARGRISRLYLMDALIEGLFVALWLTAGRRRQ
jgi:hypothetical protein